MALDREVMKTGLLVLGRYPMERLARLAQLAEWAGYDYLWHADERFFREVYASLTFCALQTMRIRLGTCVTDPYSRHPALTAMAIATLDEISEGRAVLGVGAGVSGFAELGIARARSAQAIREAVLLVRRLWAGERVTFHGALVRFQDGQLDFAPPRKAIPVLVASHSPRGLEVAGEVADLAMMQGVATPAGLAYLREHVGRGIARAGRPPGSVKLIARLNTCIAADGRRAREVMRPTVVRTLIAEQPAFRQLTAAGLRVPETLAAKVTGLGYTHDPAVLAALAPEIPDAFVDALTLAGTTEEVTARVVALARAGADQVTIYPVAADDAVEETVRAFADDVMPQVRRNLRNDE
jgi:5,10-methylenetetrahydromethanopterin reductase